MRSSKSRSRSKSNRPRTIGNIVNRVFDSSGPEGKVRGTPQQIIEKYQILARDAQLSNDRVAAENFQQHAEHYTRMLGEAQRELAAEQDQRRDTPHNGNQNGGYGQPQQGGYRDRPMRDDGGEPASVQRVVPVIDLADDADDSGLVETPEARARQDGARSEAPREYRERAPQPERQDRREDRPRYQDRRQSQPQPHQPQPQPELPVAEAPPAQSAAVEPLSPMMPSFAPPEPAAAAEPKAEAKPRRPRAPRKPKAAEEAGDTAAPVQAEE